MNWLDRLAAIPGTIVSAAAETIQLLPLEGALPNLALATSFRHPWIDLWRWNGIRTFCLEESFPDAPATTTELLLHPATLEWLSSLPAPVRVLVFKPEDRVEQTLGRAGIELLNPHAGLSRRLENKLNFPALAAEAGLDSLPYSFFTLSDALEPATVFDELGDRVIIQFAKGFSGNRTFLVRSGDEFRAVRDRFRDRKCRICAFRDGATWTANGCVVSPFQVTVRPPFMQITRWSDYRDGLPPTVGSRGNLWAPPAPDVAQWITTAMEATGRMLGRYGFRGIFGADFLHTPDDGRTVMIEINPRLVASIPILTPIEMTRGMPLIAAHILALTSDEIQQEIEPIEIPTRGGQIIFRGSDEGVDALSREMGSGIYRVSSDRGFEWVSDGWSPSHVRGSQCLIWKPPIEKTLYSERLRLVFDQESDTWGDDPVLFFHRHL